MQENQQSTPPQAPSEGALKNSGLAIASLVLSIVGLVTCIGAIVLEPIALVFGIVGYIQINREKPRLQGKNLALAGMIISAIGLIMIPFLAIPAAILFPVFRKASAKATQAKCMSNIRQDGLALMMYADDHDGKLPDPANWNQAVESMKVSPDCLKCPAVSSPLPSYAMNAQLKGTLISDVKMPDNTVAIFDSVPGANQSGGPELLPVPGRHLGSNIVVYADGHAKAVPQGATMNLNWDPKRVQSVVGAPVYH